MHSSWVLSDYRKEASVTLLLLSLNWLTLQQCRLLSRLTLFYKIVNNLLCTNDSPTMLALNAVPHQTVSSGT